MSRDTPVRHVARHNRKQRWLVGELAGSVLGIEMFDIAQLDEAERVPITHLHGDQPSDRRVRSDEPIPLPRNRIEPVEVAQHHSIGAGMSEHGNPAF